MLPGGDPCVTHPFATSARDTVEQALWTVPRAWDPEGSETLLCRIVLILRNGHFPQLSQFGHGRRALVHTAFTRAFRQGRRFGTVLAPRRLGFRQRAWFGRSCATLAPVTPTELNKARTAQVCHVHFEFASQISGISRRTAPKWFRFLGFLTHRQRRRPRFRASPTPRRLCARHRD